MLLTSKLLPFFALPLPGLPAVRAFLNKDPDVLDILLLLFSTALICFFWTSNSLEEDSSCCSFFTNDGTTNCGWLAVCGLTRVVVEVGSKTSESLLDDAATTAVGGFSGS